MTDIPVKTLVMQAIGISLSTITELISVNRWRNAPVDLENKLNPCLFFYELVNIPSPRNRLMMNELRLVLDTYVDVPAHGYEDFTDTMDYLEAKIHNAMFSSTNSVTLKGLVLECQQGPTKKEEASDVVALLRMEFFITYGHNMGNAFSCVNY
jgi:hypothetical protein